MINRILIRIKVVQMLYSFLLVEQNFALASPPETPTREKRFAYSFYLDMLLLLVKIAGQVSKGQLYPLKDNRFIRIISADDRIKSLIMKYSTGGFPYEGLVAPLAAQVKDSLPYKNYLKKEGKEVADDIKVLQEIFRLIIVPSVDLRTLASEQPNYSLSGEEKGRAQIDSTFERFLTSQSQKGDALATMRASMEKARELYFRLLALPIAITRYRAQEIDEALHKYIVSDEDRNPNLRFVENSLVRQLEDNGEIQEYLSKQKIDWMVEDRTLVELLWRTIRESDVYADYMDMPATDRKEDTEFWRNVFKWIIFPNEAFLEKMEDKSIFWNDDLEIVGTFMLKTLKRLGSEEESGEAPVMPMYKDDEDARFGSELFSHAVTNRVEYQQMVNDALGHGNNWDADRLAFMDVVVMITAIAELLNFPKIPTSVSINEYIELAKSYSTPKSGNFVHGILGAVVKRLREEGRLVKP